MSDLLPFEGELDDTQRSQLDSLLRRFAADWKECDEPDLPSHLPDWENSLRTRALVELIKLDQHARWRRGRPTYLEEYLERWPELRSDSDRVRELLIEECHARGTYATLPESTELESRFGSTAGGLDLRAIGMRARTASIRESFIGTERFFLVRKIGAGGMGEVYSALDRDRNCLVALKLLPQARPDRLYQFKKEFRLLAEIVHPNLVPLFELISVADRWFFTMELVHGSDFLKYVTKHASGEFREDSILAGEDTLDYVEPAVGTKLSKFVYFADDEKLRDALRQLTQGIMALHAAGKLHRDLKPSNVLVTSDGRVVILDFGLVTQFERWTPFGNRSGAFGDTAFIGDATDRRVVGTVQYMSPEQAAGRHLTEASDWYSVGVMLHEALTGCRPYSGNVDHMYAREPLSLSLIPGTTADALPQDLNDLCVALLHHDPALRPTGEEVLERLSGCAPTTRIVQSAMCPSPLPFVGRQTHLAALYDALKSIFNGQAVTVHVHGASGAGKTRLVHQFLVTAAEHQNMVILSGRCYERESVPYKALDSLVDSLSRYLKSLPAHEADALMPRDIAALARVFPVLERVGAVVRAPQRALDLPELRELRRRAFASLREVLIRIGDRVPLVLHIDDLQWGDEDSAAVLSEVIRPPDPPRLLLLVGYRSEYLEDNACLNALRRATPRDLPRRDVEVGPLTLEDSRRLALLLLGQSEPQVESLADVIARESLGTPYFIGELVEHVRAGGNLERVLNAPRQFELEKVLWQRVERLPEAERRLLEVITVAGHPVAVRDAQQAAQQSDHHQKPLAELRARHLVRTDGPGPTDCVESFHDRIRESVLANLPPDQLREHHAHLAATLEHSGNADAETIAVHFYEAGQHDEAGVYFLKAADQAARALAFDRAARLYQQVLNLGRVEADQVGEVHEKLGDAHANAGRGAEAARHFETAARGRDILKRTDLGRREAYQYCISGHVDEGCKALRRVLREVGMKLPDTPRQAFISLLAGRLQLWLRGIDYRTRELSAIDRRALNRIDVAWAASAGLSMFDLIAGALFQTHNLLLSLRSGEPYRIARALAWEAAHTSNHGGAKWHRTQELLAAAEVAAHLSTHPHAQGIAVLSHGIAEFTMGHWQRAFERLEEAENVLRNRCTGVAWELGTTHAFLLWCLLYMGRLGEMNQLSSQLLNEAEQRGDLYAATTLGAYTEAMARLAEDAPERARQAVRASLARWSHEGFHVQHIIALLSETYIDLYCGRGDEALRRLRRQMRMVRGSHLLVVQVLRIFIHYLTGLSTLACSQSSSGARRAIHDVRRTVRRLRRERMPYADAMAETLNAPLTFRQAGAAATADALESVGSRFDELDMGLFAAAIRRRQGQCIGGTSGRQLIDQADHWMVEQRIANPERMADAFVPRLNL